MGFAYQDGTAGLAAEGAGTAGEFGRGSPGTGSALSHQDIAAGLKEALSVGVDKIVAQLGVPGGFNDDPAVHIPVPESLKTAQSTLDKVGMGAIESCDQVMAQYQRIRFVPDVKAELSDYVVEKASDGLSHYLAAEEAAIRRDPAQRAT